MGLSNILSRINHIGAEFIQQKSEIGNRFQIKLKNFK